MKISVNCLFGGLLTIALLFSCSDPVEQPVPEEQNKEEEVPAIELLAPEDGISADLEQVEGVTFSWTAIENVNSYKILLSLKEDMSGAVEITATKNPYTVSSTKMDAKLQALSIGYEAEKKLYWKVVVYGSQENSGESSVRTITLKRRKEAQTNNEDRIADPLTVKVAVVIEDLVVPGTGGKRMHEVCACGSPGGINPNGGSWYDPWVQMQEFERDLETASHGVVQYEIVDIQQSDRLFTYDKIYEKDEVKTYLSLDSLLIRYQDRRVDNLTSYDYIGMMKHYGYDKMVNAGELHEIWVYAGAASGMWESQMIGTDAFWCNSSGIGVEQGAPCHELCIVMCCNYERSTDLALHSYGHRAESIMKYVYGGWDIKNKHRLEDVNNWELFAAYHKDYQPFKKGYSHIGNIHFPANGSQDYDYDSMNYVYTYADSWYDYPNLSTENARRINANEWKHPGGGQWGYMLWFFDHIPHFKGLNPKDGHLNNWWHYIVHYKDALRQENRLVMENM